jgi:hypothetical protein
MVEMRIFQTPVAAGFPGGMHPLPNHFGLLPFPKKGVTEAVGLS